MWILYGLFASVLWGLTYVIDEQLFKKISISTTLAVSFLFSFITMFIISSISGKLKPDVDLIISDKNILTLVVISIITFTLAELFIAFSIHSKNATLSSLIEISYPLFIIILGYILFKENNLNSSVIVGGVLIFSGIFVIYYFNYN